MTPRYMCTCLAVLLLTAAAQAGQWQDFSGFDPAELATNDHVFNGGPGVDGIPAMTNPDFVPAARADFVVDSDLIMGVYMHGVAKAYTQALGWHHEIVNDVIGGQAISVTFCPLTGTALTFNATGEDGQPFELGVSGLLMNSNLIMYDRRDFETLIPQMIYTAFSGPGEGTELELLPMVETTWGMWKRMYPDTQVAVPGTGLEMYPERQRARYANISRYQVYPYNDYRTSNRLIFPVTTNFPDLDTVYLKDVVLGLCRNGEVKSYAFDAMPDGAVINDELGSEPVVIAFDRDSNTAIPYSSRVGGRELTFYAVDPTGDLPVEFQDVETGMRWNMLGHAMEGGELEGHRLEQVPAYNSMWFAWDTYWQGAPRWEGEGIIEAPPVTAVEEEGQHLPSRFALGQNYPNPFNPATHIQVNLPRSSPVSVRVYDTLGQLVRTLMSGDQEAGFYLLSWDGRDETGTTVASGTYLYRLEASSAGIDQTRTMTLLR